jgi:ATP-dependent helicase/nuclease subunit B
LNNERLPPGISAALESDATLLVPTAQRQAAVRAAWSAQQRASGRKWWNTPRVHTFPQFAQKRLADAWAAANLPDRLLSPGAEWALLREFRREQGSAEARALLNSIRTLRDWQVPKSRAALGGSPEGDLLLEAVAELESQSHKLGRKPLRDWLDELAPAPGGLFASGLAEMPPAQRAALQRLGARAVDNVAPPAAVAMATARDDEHELELIGAWCRAKLEQDPHQHLLIVDARLRQRRRQYERLLSQTLSPSEWVSGTARAFSTIFAIEGGQPLTDFPLVTHGLLTLRLLSSSLRFDEVVLWLQMPFLDGDDLFAGAAIEAALRDGHKLEFSAAQLAGFLEGSQVEPARGLAAKLRQASELVDETKRAAPDWAQRMLAALRVMGWPGSRTLRSDELQTTTRVYALLDEYAELGAWLPRASAADAVSILGELARDRSFDPASVEAPVTLTDSHDDPIVRYDGIWVAGVDAAQWPPAPRPDVFIPLRLQVAAGIPAASAAGQTQRARRSLAAWRAATSGLVCSWAELDGDAQRTHSPLLSRLPDLAEYAVEGAAAAPLASRLRAPQLEAIQDVQGVPVDINFIVRGGVKPLALQAECGFHAYGEMRLGAERLEDPSPGLDPRARGMLLHKALELVWDKFDPNFLTVADFDPKLVMPAIADSVRAAVAHVFKGRVPPELRLAVEREEIRLERLIVALFRVESKRTTTFHIESRESSREVVIAGGTFQVRIDRIDSLQGGGYAILDYKAGDPGPLRWEPERMRNPQLLAYLLAEEGRNVQALANISLTRGRAKFIGKASRAHLLPGVSGFSPGKVPAEQIDAAWQDDIQRWTQALRDIAARYLAGKAPVQPAPDVCRHCHLTVLCRRVELETVDVVSGEGSRE